eukprot:gnl/Dysnectes_brevis/6346_a9786_329.p2 GENE.gnl/Dysnectes_brevis/6346_a9786_329~~gnl/Dysnectes_brevis/6346_a9786_329.p2  ORF type:complete len:119 (-),score=28.94 gnl/Dysnectes_brevis/6346_a9786_329:77-433(-)
MNLIKQMNMSSSQTDDRIEDPVPDPKASVSDIVNTQLSDTLLTEDDSLHVFSISPFPADMAMPPGQSYSLFQDTSVSWFIVAVFWRMVVSAFHVSGKSAGSATCSRHDSTSRSCGYGT